MAPGCAFYLQQRSHVIEELLKGEACSKESDVYRYSPVHLGVLTAPLSFGITMYELFSRKDPYEELDSSDLNGLTDEIIRRKTRPVPPEWAPQEFKNLMKVKEPRPRSSH